MTKKIGRSELCPCGSGRKYKYCCISKEVKKRIVPTTMQCTQCGEKLNADMTDEFLNKIASINLPLKNFCKDNDLYLFGFLRLHQIEKLNDRLANDSLTQIDILDSFKHSIDKEAAIGLLKDSCELHDAFKKRFDILRDAFDAHFEGKYTLSIPVMLSQLEGILRDVGSLDLKDKFRPTIPRDEWNSRLLFEMTDNAEYFNAFISRLFEGQKDQDSFNRNPILHGMNVSYYSEEWSLILILAILEIRSFVWFKHKVPVLIA